MIIRSYTIKQLEKLNKKEKGKIQVLLNEEAKYWKLKELKLENILNSEYLRNHIFVFVYIDNKVVAKLRYFLKEIKDKILLYRFTYKNGKYCFIQNIYVRDRYRKKGLCSKLLNYLNNNIEKTYKQALVVDSINKKAIICYEKNNFEKIIERNENSKIIKTNKYSENFTEYLMIR